MKRILTGITVLLAVVCLLVVPSYGQTANTPFPTAAFYASAFGVWSINGQSPNTYTFQGRNICTQSAQNTVFFPFATNAPVYIADQTTANSEVVTPSAIVNTAGSCGVTIAPSNPHYTFALRSGTGGLQEAINAVHGSASAPAFILLDRNWYVFAANVPGKTPQSILAAAVNGSGVVLQDITTAPNTFYQWNGSAFYAAAGVTGGAVNPTPAAGVAAGTGPTIALASGSNANIGIVKLTTGTTSTTGTILTLTWPTSGSFTYAPSCTFTSVGANAYLTGTTAVAYTSSHAVLTFTEATAPTADSTAYQFKYVCQ